jgi:uncharacterized protein YicC (UPF0701 family)
MRNGTSHKALFKKALTHLIDFRKQEGAALQKKFTEKVDNIEKLLAGIEPYEKARVPMIKEDIIKHLKEIPEVEYNNNRLEEELGLLYRETGYQRREAAVDQPSEIL